MNLELIEECFIKGTVVFSNHTSSSSSQLCLYPRCANVLPHLIINTEDALILVVLGKIRICLEDADIEFYCNNRAGLMGFYNIFGSRVLWRN